MFTIKVTGVVIRVIPLNVYGFVDFSMLKFNIFSTPKNVCSYEITRA